MRRRSKDMREFTREIFNTDDDDDTDGSEGSPPPPPLDDEEDDNDDSYEDKRDGPTNGDTLLSLITTPMSQRAKQVRV